MTRRALPGLTAAETTSWLVVVRTAMWLPAALDGQLRRDSGMSHFEYALLASLGEEPSRPLRMKHLAAITGSELSRLSHAIERLEKRAWVTRQRDPADGRVSVVSLTAAGYRAVTSATPAHIAHVRALFIDQMTVSERDTLRELLSRVIEMIVVEGGLPVEPDAGDEIHPPPTET